MQEQLAPKRQSTFPLFSKHFNLHPTDALEYSNSMRKQMQDFIEAFKKRIDVEQSYAKNLFGVSRLLDKYVKPGTELSSSFISSAFKIQHEQRARQALELAESLKVEIELLCVDTLKTHTFNSKKIQKDLKKYYKDADNLEENFKSALQNYQGISKQTQEMIITKNIMKFTTGIPQQKKTKLIMKTIEGIKENKQYQRIYMQALKEFNNFAINYNKQITAHLDILENQVRDQIILQADCLRKLIVAEVSMFKNIQYDLLNISKQMETLDTQRDVEIFTDEHKNVMTNYLITPEQKEQKQSNLLNNTPTEPSNTLELKKAIGMSMLNECLRFVEQDYFGWMLANKVIITQYEKNKTLRSITEKIWKQNKKHKREQKQKIQDKRQEAKKENQLLNQKKQEEQVEKIAVVIQNDEKQYEKELKQYLKSLKIISPSAIPSPMNPSVQSAYEVFLEITSIIDSIWNGEELVGQALDKKLQTLEQYFSRHHFYRLIGYIYIQQYRVQHQVVIKSIPIAKICGKLIRSLLKQSLNFNDVFIIRGLLGLIFTFYWNDDKSKRLLYQILDIYQSQVWKKPDFWEGAIFQTTYEEMAIFLAQKGETQAETILRQKNVIFSQLASFCHYMIMLGITPKNVRMIVGRYCRLYEMSQQQNKDLSKMITNTYKQYKDMIPLFTAKSTQKSSILQ